MSTAARAVQRVTVLGATGSIGVSTLDVLARFPERYEVFALTGQNQVALLAEQCRRFRPSYAVVTDETAGQALRELLRGHTGTEVLVGTTALADVAAAPEADVVMAAIVGAAGLLPTLAAVQAGKRVLLANKEALVMAGNLFMSAVAQHQALLLPIDSEHNAIFQCLPADYRGVAAAGVDRILLSASGGPFRTRPVHELATVTPDEACAHPNWSMGRKISVDSATMMNKGLELIEACWLFQVGAERVQVVIHPQSIVHSLVSYVDGSVLAQLGNPDMRTPIAHALAWPERMPSGVDALDLFRIGRLDFEEPDLERFPCLRLAAGAAAAGGSAPTALNAANEVAVAAFLEGMLPFTAIAQVVETVLNSTDIVPLQSLEQVLACDADARRRAGAAVANLAA